MKKILIILLVAFAGTGFAQNTTESAKVDTAKKLSIIQHVERWYGHNMTYGTITLLMTVESSLIPFPSEIVIPPAAYVASSDDPEKNPNGLNIYLVVLFGTIGALIGAYINYFLALWLGRPIIHKLVETKLGRLMGLSSAKVDHAEKYFNDHGKTTTFVGRLLPVIRQLISLPAGLAKMNFLVFSIFTFLGAGLWNAILALLGYFLGTQSDQIDKYSHELSYGLLVVVILVLCYYVHKNFIKKKKQA